MDKLTAVKISCEKIHELVEDTENNYLLVVFGGKTGLPAYDFFVHIGKEQVTKDQVTLMDRDSKDIISDYITNKAGLHPDDIVIAIEAEINSCLASGECKSMDIKQLYNICKELTEGGFEELEYFKL